MPSLDAQTSDFLAEGEEPLVAKRGTPRFGTGTMPMVNYLADTNRILADADITDAEKVSQLKAGINELTTESLGFPPEQINRFSFSNPFVSMAAASTLDSPIIEKPNQLQVAKNVENLVTGEFTSEDIDEASSALIKATSDHYESQGLSMSEVMSGLARDTLYDMIPSSLANLTADVVMKNLLGMPVQTTYVTEQNLNESEQSLLKKIVVSALKNPEIIKGQKSAGMNYTHYPKNSRGISASQLVGTDKSSTYKGVLGTARYLKDLFAEDVNNMAYTLGGASLAIDEDGNLIVTDQYDAQQFKRGSANKASYGAIRDFLGNAKSLLHVTAEDPNIVGENPNAIRFRINLGPVQNLLGGEKVDLSHIPLDIRGEANVEALVRTSITPELPIARPSSLVERRGS